MKGRHVDASDDHEGDDGSSAHGLDCPVCDDGTLSKRAATSVRAELVEQNKLANVSNRARYVYACDECDYIEEVVRDGQEG